MALADLRALAHRVPPPEPVTPVTRDPLPTGYKVEAQKTEGNRQFQEPVTRVTPVTRDLGNVGRGKRTGPANDLAPPLPTDAPLAALAEPGLSDAEWVEAMAAALMANPVNTITNRDMALLYYRGRALAMLAATPDPYARGLMLGFERHRHMSAIALHSRPTSRCQPNSMDAT